MEHLKKKITEELHDLDRKIEAKGDFNYEELCLIYKLAKAHYYLCKVEEKGKPVTV